MTKKKIIMIIIGVIIGYLATFNHIGCKGATDSNNDTTPSRTQLIWKNGSLGAWGGDAITGGIVIWPANYVTWSNVTVTDNVSGGSPCLQGTSDDFSDEWLQFKLNNAQNCSAFSYGHLQFNMRLETTTILKITVKVGDGNSFGQEVTLTTSAFNTSQFTHASISLQTLLGNFNAVQYLMILKITRSPLTPGIPLVTVNDVKWTTD